MNSHAILIVDDDPSVLRALGSRLQHRGLTVELASSGDAAIQLFTDRKVDRNSGSAANEFELVITDLTMEGTGGIDVLRRIKELSPDTMVMILTGSEDLHIAIEALRSGADEYLLKSSKPEELFFRVARCLEKLEYQRKIKIYERLLPVCCVCKKIRDDEGKSRGSGDWLNMEEYLREKARIDVTHTYCDHCEETFRAEMQLHQGI